MNKLKDKFKLYQIFIMIYFICHASFCGVTSNLIINLSREDCWIVPIITTIIGIIPISIIIYILNHYPDSNIFEIIQIVFGNRLGKFINFLLILFVSSYFIIFYWNLTDFISSQYLYNTPQTFIAILFAIPTIYLISKGIKTVLKSSIIIFILSVLFFGISALALIPQIKLENIQPILASGINGPLKSVLGCFSYLILPIFIITCIPKSSFKNQNNYEKKIIIFYLITQLTIELIIFGILGIFGIELSLIYQYPEFQILRRVTIGGFIERVESTLSIHWILDLFMLIVFLSCFIKIGLCNVFNIKNRIINKSIFYSFLVFLIFLSTKVFSNNTLANIFFIKKYPLYCLIFFLGIPILIFIKSILKKHSN